MKRVERKAKAETAARERLLECRARKAETERRIATLRAEHEQAEHEQAARALIPGGGTAVATKPPTELAEEIRALEAEERDAEAALEAAEREHQEAILAEVPGVAEEVANARERLRAALAELGEAAVERYREVLAAEAAHRNAVGELERFANQVKGDPRLASRQRGELRRWLRQTADGATPEEMAGWLVARMLGWSRRASSPIEEYWRSRGVPLFSGSVLAPGNPPIISEDVHKLRGGRLPL